MQSLICLASCIKPFDVENAEVSIFDEYGEEYLFNYENHGNYISSDFFQVEETALLIIKINANRSSEEHKHLGWSVVRKLKQ